VGIGRRVADLWGFCGARRSLSWLADSKRWPQVLSADHELINGIGVAPDYYVPLTAHDLSTGHDPGIAKALTLLGGLTRASRGENGEGPGLLRVAGLRGQPDTDDRCRAIVRADSPDSPSASRTTVRSPR
jgi:hypothetical protein